MTLGTTDYTLIELWELSISHLQLEFMKGSLKESDDEGKSQEF